jgi:hypothetical protein
MNERGTMSNSTWIDEIAAASKEPVDTVLGVLNKLGISLRVEIAIPRRLHIRSVAFSGERRGTDRDGPFNFTWNDLGPGLWAVTSGRNFRGKSSILGVIMWAIRGRPADLPDNVRNWISQLTLKFALDERVLCVSFSKTDKIVGTLTDVTSGTEKTLFQFDDDATFERTMSAFFMDQLQLSQVNVFNSKNEGTSGTTVAHGWPWLSTALHIGSRTDVLFGETAVGGLPIRMMQMFVGVPAATTLADIKVAQGRQRSQNTVQDVSRQLQVTQRTARLTILRAQLAEVDGKISTLRPIDSQRHELEKANASFVTAERHYRLQLGRLATIEGAASEARAIYDQDRRLAQQFKEERAAGFVFRSLEPVCCPACDTGFDTARRSDMHARHVCVVCGTDDAPTADSAGEQMLLDSSIAASHAALKAAESSLVQLQADIAQARKAVDDSRQLCERLNSLLAASGERTSLENNRLGIVARIEELSLEGGAPDNTPPVDAKILDAAEKVTRRQLSNAQDELLAEISELIRDYGQKFGIENLRETTLDGAGRLKVKNADTETTFSKLTDGERARLKVAATIAILRMSERRGLGRHPGLVLIDSPGNNETVPSDYQALLAGLAEVTKELPHLQIITAACNNPIITANVLPQNQLSAEGDDYLW